MRQRLLLVTVAAAALWLATVALSAPQEPTGSASAAGAEAVTYEVEDCAACHEDQVRDFARSPHSALDREGLAARAGAEWSCVACHGDPSAHMDEGGGEGNLFAFDDGELPAAVDRTCLTCHGDVHPRFRASPHAAAGLSCTSCHSIHSAAEGSWALLASDGRDRVANGRLGAQISAATASCIECHGDVFAEFQLNERHRLEEGILDCTSCHDPHAPSVRARLAAFKQEACIDCHSDKGGPFVFEHGSSRVDGCVACHSPHGSPNRHQLKAQNVAELCFSCHAGVPQFHFGFNPAAPPRFNLDTNCTNCHSTIHGSNFDPFFLK